MRLALLLEGNFLLLIHVKAEVFQPNNMRVIYWRSFYKKSFAYYEKHKEKRAEYTAQIK